MPNYKPYASIDDLYKDAQILPSSVPKSRAGKNAQYNQFKYQKNTNAANQTVIVKKFGKKSYNGPTKNDFIERFNIVFETAKQLLDAQYKEALLDPDYNRTEYNRKVKKLEKAKKEALKEIMTCEIKPILLDDLLKNKNEAAIVEVIKKATGHIQAFIFKSLAINQPDAFQNADNLTKALTQFAEAESALTAEKGRPNFVNYYPVNSTIINPTTRVSIQRVIGEAIPSTERLGKQPGKLPNFVECGVGYLDATTGAYRQQFKGYRHSSYPPIKLSKPTQDFERKQGAALAVKDMLTELARQQYDSTNPTQKLELNLSSLTLLSPITLLETGLTNPITDKVLLPEGESEHLQLVETYDALMMYNGREIELDIDGKKVKVTPTINLMNAASNPMGIYASTQGLTGKKLAQSTLEQNINAQGMNTYITQTEDYLRDHGIILNEHLTNNPKLDKIQRELDQLKVELTIRCADLEKALMAGNSNQHKIISKEIDLLRQVIYKKEVELLSERKNIFEKNRSDFKKNINDIKKSIGHLNKGLYPVTTNMKETHRKSNEAAHKKIKAYEIAALYYQSLAMYMDGKLEPDHFGARYLLANERMGNSVDFFCKSGEDRTGRMQNLVEELCEFSRENGRFPDYDFNTQEISAKDMEKQRKIAVSVCEFSVSRDINDQNVHGARGLQVGEGYIPGAKLLGRQSTLNEGLPFLSGDILGKTAKGVYGLTDAILLAKKLYPIDKKRLDNIKDSLKNSRANILMEKNMLADFTSQIIRADEREAYELKKHAAPISGPEEPRTDSSFDVSLNVIAEGVRLEEKELAVLSKAYKAEKTAKPITGILEQDHTGRVKDYTRIKPPEKLSREDNIELAMQNAKMLLSTPHDSKHPLILHGADSEQVARLHAAVLYLKNSHPVLKSIVVKVRGASLDEPIKADWFGQQKYDDEFIERQLGKKPSGNHQTELTALIHKQQEMKLVVKSTGSEMNLIEGDTLKK